MLFGFNSTLVARREASSIHTQKCRGSLSSRRDPRLRMWGRWTPRPISFISLPFLTSSNFFLRLRFMSILYACQVSSVVWWSINQICPFSLWPDILPLGSRLSEAWILWFRLHIKDLGLPKKICGVDFPKYSPYVCSLKPYWRWHLTLTFFSPRFSGWVNGWMWLRFLCNCRF
jgi:hypothetical protein